MSNTDQDYQAFLASKRFVAPSVGIPLQKELNTMLFPYQRDLIRWSLAKGRAAILADCGLGKSFCQTVWADHVHAHTQEPVLILAPLAVAKQTIREAEKLGIPVTECASQSDVVNGINITNYEKLHKFGLTSFSGVVLDESSILKSLDGKTKTGLIEGFANTPFKLACTATPAPNDHMELGNHAEFLGAMTRTEMLATFFVHDGGDTSQWRLKGHAQDEFWKWVCSWAAMIRKPSDLGYDDKGFILPELKVKHITVEAQIKAEIDQLFAMPASSLSERRKARKESLGERVSQASELANIRGDEQWLVWCDRNDESEALTKAIKGAVEVKGSTPEYERIDYLTGFSEGRYRVIVSKPSIAGWGMNWQQCHNVLFVGLSDSYESYYQAVRRCWRFGQKEAVNAYVITSQLENAVLENIKRKEHDANVMASSMIEHMKSTMIEQVHGATVRTTLDYKRNETEGKGWKMVLGDCVDSIKDVKSNSIHFSCYSPPFSSLYTYSNSERDMGNCRDMSEFAKHYRFLCDELYRVIMPGRLMAVHCMNLPTSKERHGYIGIQDFRGDLIRMYQDAGFIYHSEVCIFKDPVTAMQRTKALGLLHKQLKKDSCMSRQGIPDYLVVMRKPGENPERVTHTNESFPVDLWQRYASPVWMDINPSDTLQRESAREHNDERHVAPLQLQVIQRALELWSNHGDLVLSPFAGIGSEGYQAVKMGRRFLGFELKESYYKQACLNLEAANADTLELSFDGHERAIEQKQVATLDNRIIHLDGEFQKKSTLAQELNPMMIHQIEDQAQRQEFRGYEMGL
jgi:superfamily II DNA or RNA helicase